MGTGDPSDEDHLRLADKFPVREPIPNIPHDRLKELVALSNLHRVEHPPM